MSILNYDSEDLDIYTCLWNKPVPWSVVVNTSNKRFELTPLEHLSIKNNKERFKTKTIKISFWDKKFKLGLRMQVEKLVDFFSYRNNDLPTFRQSLNTIKLINKLYNI